MEIIERRFGTMRGLVRLGLAYAEVATGRDGSRQPDAADVRRLVFVCHGNICRSAFAQVVANRLGYRNSGFGLSTSADKPAHPPVVAAAAQRGLDMSAHRTQRVEDFVPQPGDLLIGMEVRHLRKLAGDERLTSLPRVLLGGYGSPPVPHIHDPYQLNESYLPVCLDRIEDAVTRLVRQFPGTRTVATGG